MSLWDSGFWDFGDFRFNCKTGTLLRYGAVIELQPQTVVVLKHLILNRNRIVSREELLKECWGTVFVSPNAVDYQIFTLRNALGDVPKSARYIETKYRRGWRFIAEVREIADVPRPEVHPSVPETEPATMLGADVTPERHNGRKTVGWIVALSACCIFFFEVTVLRSDSAEVLRFVDLTNDGRPKSGPLLTDGHRLYFKEAWDGFDGIGSIPLTGGRPVRVPAPRGAQLQDISADGKHLLLLTPGKSGSMCAAEFSLRDKSIQQLSCGVSAAAYQAKNRISFVIDGGLLITDLNSPAQSKRVGELGNASELRWSPDGGTLRYDLPGAHGEGALVFEFARPPRRLRYLEHGEGAVIAGSWSRNGKYFFYGAANGHGEDIFAEKAKKLSFFTPSSFQITHGPGSWTSPISLSDSQLFAIHREERPALVQFKTETNDWQEMWDRSPDFELDYSPDGQWVAFVDQQDHTVWKAKPDGSERLQLTRAGLNAYQPHWSRDGTRIAFMGQNRRGDYRIFVVQASGSKTEELQPDGEDQGVPTWSPDDRWILFGERLGQHPRAEMSLHMLNVETHRPTILTGTKGLWSPRWSPDGNKILAVTTDRQTIRVSPPEPLDWRDIASMAVVDNVTWSPDSRYIYFNGKLTPSAPWALYRVAVARGSLEKLTELRKFQMPVEYGFWFGVSPDGTLLASEAFQRDEICELLCKLP